MKRILFVLASVVFITGAVPFCIQRTESLEILYAVQGKEYDRAAYGNLLQTLEVNVQVEMRDLNKVSARQLKHYDAVYLDIMLHHSDALQTKQNELIQYVKNGGHLFLENAFADDFPANFLGAAQTATIPAVDLSAIQYPVVGHNLQGVQQMVQRFTDNFNKHIGLSSLPGYSWGIGIVPSTAETIMSVNGISLMTLNRVGAGTVLLNSNFLPNRYFITGFDLQSGMDPSQGFNQLLDQRRSFTAPDDGTAYFNRYRLPLEPYFHFAFAAANYELRNAYLSFVSKEEFGYSIRKILGPYGRPAMAYQNHYEALSGIRDHDAEQWTEFLRGYNQIPSFSLVRASYDWGEWYESIVVHLNKGSQNAPVFLGEHADSFYGSGIHIASDGQPLTLNTYPEYVDLSSPIKLPDRAYPAFADLNGDGNPDLIVGSSDGYMYRYPNKGAQYADYENLAMPESAQSPDAFGSPDKLRTSSGEPLRTPGYTAISTDDLNSDGETDLLVGDQSGTVMYTLNQGKGVYSLLVPFTVDGRKMKVPSYSAPTRGDVDGDGIPDLVVGDASGNITLFRGRTQSNFDFAPGEVLVQVDGKFASPTLRDLDGDDRLDLLAGNGKGDIQTYIQKANHWDPRGALLGEMRNPAGSHSLVGGHNSVPLWYDLNHDGLDDLVVGHLEFGMPHALDDPQFPYVKELNSFIQYARDHFLEIYPHLFFHQYMNEKQEKNEIDRHRQVFKKLGIPWKSTGTNQHTWRINNEHRLQTLWNENANDIWFNFGFRPSHTPSDPRAYSDYMWGVPFLLQDDTIENPMLLFTPLPLFIDNTTRGNFDIYDTFAKQDMPMIYMEHIEYLDENIQRFEKFVRYFDEVRTAYDYNFVTEPQAARSFLTALTGKVEVSQSWGTYWINKVKDRFGKGRHLNAKIRARLDQVPIQAGSYKETLGVFIEPGESYLGQPFHVGSDIYMKKDGGIYTGLEKGVVDFQISWEEEPLHVLRVNVPISIDKNDKQWNIHLLDTGMQQLKLYSSYPLTIEGPDLKIEKHSDSDMYTITHYGDKVTVTIHTE